MKGTSLHVYIKSVSHFISTRGMDLAIARACTCVTLPPSHVGGCSWLNSLHASGIKPGLDRSDVLILSKSGQTGVDSSEAKLVVRET